MPREALRNRPATAALTAAVVITAAPLCGSADLRLLLLKGEPEREWWAAPVAGVSPRPERTAECRPKHRKDCPIWVDEAIGGSTVRFQGRCRNALGVLARSQTCEGKGQAVHAARQLPEARDRG
jgi:hypothetical protein